MSGEAWVYANWDDGGPNFATERYANFFRNNASAAFPIRQSTWNNVSDDAAELGNAIEYDSFPVSGTLVPPASLLLLQ